LGEKLARAQGHVWEKIDGTNEKIVKRGDRGGSGKEKRENHGGPSKKTKARNGQINEKTIGEKRGCHRREKRRATKNTRPQKAQKVTEELAKNPGGGGIFSRNSDKGAKRRKKKKPRKESKQEKTGGGYQTSKKKMNPSSMDGEGRKTKKEAGKTGGKKGGGKGPPCYFSTRKKNKVNGGHLKGREKEGIITLV